MARWVRTWQSAGPELEAFREYEAAVVDVQTAVRDLFTGMDAVLTAPGAPTSGLVEQQMWFSKLRAREFRP